MKKTMSAILALAAASTVAVTSIPAQADSFGGGRNHYRGNHQAYNGDYRGGDRYRGRGHWNNGKWIALGVGAAIIAGAAASANRDCYWRDGYRYCD